MDMQQAQVYVIGIVEDRMSYGYLCQYGLYLHALGVFSSWRYYA